MKVQTSKQKKLIKSYSTTFREFYSVIFWSETKPVQQCFEKFVQVTFEGLTMEDWVIEKFKEACKIDFV